MIDGASPIQAFFTVVFPMLKPTAITVAILNTMWIWNDYLLPYLVLGSDKKTIPVAIQLAMQGAYGSTDYGGFMAMLVRADNYFLYFLPKIYYKRRCCRRS
jgi:raffinose/stachyose/melibiose transport system permease protein